MARTAQQIADKWSRNLAASTQAIQDGVAGVTVSPTAKAADQVSAYIAGVQRAAAEGKFSAGLRRVSLEDWRRAMTQKGIPRIASGAAAGAPKVAGFLTEFMPHLEAGQRLLESMPRGDLAQNIQRAIRMMEHNATFRRRGS